MRLCKGHGMRLCRRRTDIVTPKACYSQAKTKNSLDCHISRAHRIKHSICKICGQYFENGIKLSKHKYDINRAKIKDKVKCENCNVKVSRGWLPVHMKIHGEGAQKQYSCKKCNYKNNFKSNINRHKCQECSICFVRVQSPRLMKMHMRMRHLTFVSKKVPKIPKVYSCENCNKVSTDSSNIKKHMKTCFAKEQYLIFM